MELRQLEYLIAVADEAGFTRAAERVHVTQSGISAQIRRLERELGVTLFDRGTRSVRPTAAGEVAIDHARRVVDEVAALARAVTLAGDVVQGRLDIGMITAFSGPPLFDALAAFHVAHPIVEIGVVEGRSAALVDQVRAGDLDVALVGVADEPPTDLESRVVVRDRLMIGVTADHPLARRARVTVADICAHPLISLPVGNGIRAALDLVCEAHEVTADVTLEAGAPEAVAALASRGLGVALLSASSMGASDRLVVKPVVDADTQALLALVWRPEPAPAVRRWLDLAGDLGFGGTS
ncbi:LysR family transcriptional regulator [Williamsia sp.]|uniref:LysR family transcriptional regulator n=1 Tax=Williamsia sp. TaxID=1872085 RepID=UPI001A229E0D|nr:LysR family transcriptional regulator [Williamsia sp.]MBJ7290209.1 LysR family transcriptional regulator [Williamsia sp.]